MKKEEIITFVVKKFDEMPKTGLELLISVFRYLNPDLEQLFTTNTTWFVIWLTSGMEITLAQKD